MERQISEYLDGLFDAAPRTRRAYDLKDEMKQNLTEQYRDLVAEGRSPEEAYNIVINSLGDMGELFSQLQEEEESGYARPVSASSPSNNRSAVLTAVAVMLFILSPAAAVIGDEIFHSDVLGILGLFLFIAAGVGLLIYNHMTKDRPAQGGAEDYRAYGSPENFDASGADSADLGGANAQCTRSAQYSPEELERAKERRRISGAVQGAMWCIIVALYFLISFGTGRWSVTWIIFLIGGAASSLLGLIFGGNDPRKVANAISGALWCLLIAFYIWISFLTGKWHITWVIFLIAVAVSSLVKLIFAGGDRKRIAGAIQGAMWCVVVALYFVISFATAAWHITWIIFLVAAAASILIGLIGKGERA